MLDIEYTLSDELSQLMREGKLKNVEVEEFLKPTNEEVTRDLVEAFRNDLYSWNRRY